MSAAPAVLNLSILARQYVANGWALVPIEDGSKGPNTPGWNRRENCVTTAAQCNRIRANVGLAHAYSGTCVLDFDDLALANAWLAAHGVDPASLWDAPDAVRISSGRPNRGKLLFKLPEGATPLVTHQLHKHGLELRCATSEGKTMQDVLPPSIHPDTGKPYVWDYDDLLGDWSAPPELPRDVLNLWRSLTRPAPTEDRVREPLGVTAAAALESIKTADPDGEYPEWIEVGMALHHEFGGSDEGLTVWGEWSSRGTKYKGIEDLEYHWRTFGRETGAVKTLESLMRGLDGSPMTSDEFEVLTDETPDNEVMGRDLSANKAPRFEVQTLDQFASAKAPAWIIKSVLPRAAMALVFGASGSGKSFLVLDMVAAVCRGVDWRGMRTAKGRAVYICAEGANGFRTRIDAYLRQNDLAMGDLDLGVIPDAPNLMEKVDVVDLGKALKAFGKIDVLVVDTYARVMPGGNENDSKDAGRVVAHCATLHKITGALVVLVHHSGKDADKGARGSTALRAAADAEIQVVRTNDYRAATVTKMKDGEDGAQMAFKLHTILLGMDDDGDDISSCVVEHGVTLETHLMKEAPTGQVEKLVHGYLKGLPSEDNKTILRRELIENTFEMLDKTQDPNKKDRRKEAVGRALKSMKAKNLIDDDDYKVTLL